MVKSVPHNATARDPRDMGSVSGLGRSPGGGHGNPLQYPCLENPMDRGAWRTIVPVVEEESDITEVTAQCLAKGAVVIFRKGATGAITIKSQRY